MDEITEGDVEVIKPPKSPATGLRYTKVALRTTGDVMYQLRKRVSDPDTGVATVVLSTLHIPSYECMHRQLVALRLRAFRVEFHQECERAKVLVAQSHRPFNFADLHYILDQTPKDAAQQWRAEFDKHASTDFLLALFDWSAHSALLLSNRFGRAFPHVRKFEELGGRLGINMRES